MSVARAVRVSIGPPRHCVIRAGRIAIGQKTYPVNLRRITDPAELDQAWQARAAKTGRGRTNRAEHWWSFELTSSHALR